jgi:hypothetical protein
MISCNTLRRILGASNCAMSPPAIASPTGSPLFRATAASPTPSCAASLHFPFVATGNAIDALPSSTIIVGRIDRSFDNLIYARSLRANNFQSMRRRSSPCR